MATSGQTRAQMAQPVQSPLSLKTAGKYPAAFNLVEVDSSPLGQKEMHNAQPLHNSWEISIDPFTSAIAWKIFMPSIKMGRPKFGPYNCIVKRP